MTEEDPAIFGVDRILARDSPLYSLQRGVGQKYDSLKFLTTIDFSRRYSSEKYQSVGAASERPLEAPHAQHVRRLEGSGQLDPKTPTAD